MSGDKRDKKLVTLSAAFLGIAICLAVIPAMAQSNKDDYVFLLASGVLCDPGDSATCPAVVKSANGDSYEMSGAGTLNTQSNLVKAAGTFTHRSDSGDTLETGVWITSELIGFDSYGAVPIGLQQKGPAFGTQRFGPKGLPIPSGLMATGGLAVIRIRLMPLSGASRTAVLQLNSALGNVPRDRSVEGIRLSLKENGTEFPLEVSGRVLFLAMRPDVNAPAKTPQQAPVLKSRETPTN